MEDTTNSPLAEELHTLLSNLANAYGMIYQIKAHLIDYGRFRKRDAQGKSIYERTPMLSSVLVVSDVSKPRYAEKNFTYDFSYSLYLEDIETRSLIITQRIAMRELSYSYDIFETFLKDITAKFLLLNYQSYEAETVRLFKKELCTGKSLAELLEYSSLREKLHSLTGDGNRNLLKLIRRITPDLWKIEKENYAKVNFAKWFKALKVVRDSVIHSNFIVKREKIIDNAELQYYLTNYFNAVEVEGGMALEMTEQEVRSNIELVAEYGFQIFKHLCLVEGYEWQIFSGMND